MAKLANPLEVLEALSLSATLGDNVNAAGAALEAVSPIAENIVGSPFAFASRRDYYDVQKVPKEPGRQKRIPVVFVTKQGFISEDRKPKVWKSTDGYPIAKNKSNAERLTDRTQYVFDMENGECVVFGDIGKGVETLLIEYDAGFEVSTEVYQEVPDWLKQAAIQGSIRFMNAFTSKSNKKDVKDNSAEQARFLNMVLANHIRTRHGVVFPYRSETVG